MDKALTFPGLWVGFEAHRISLSGFPVLVLLLVLTRSSELPLIAVQFHGHVSINMYISSAHMYALLFPERACALPRLLVEAYVLCLK